MTGNQPLSVPSAFTGRLPRPRRSYRSASMVAQAHEEWSGKPQDRQEDRISEGGRGAVEEKALDIFISFEGLQHPLSHRQHLLSTGNDETQG